MERYYYKTNNGSLFNLKTPDLDNVEGYSKITEKEFNNLQKNQFKLSKSQEEVLEKHKKIEILISRLASTDYKAIKYAEGLISEEEYASIKAQRQAWRDEINELKSFETHNK